MLNKEVCRKCVQKEYGRMWSSREELDISFGELWNSGTGFCWRDVKVKTQGPFADECSYKHLHSKSCDYCKERHCNQCEIKKD